MSNQAILRITRELADIQKGSDLSIAVACRDVDVRNVKALIIGPPETPYEFGFFEFSIRFPKGLLRDLGALESVLQLTLPDYPGNAPSVHAVTTNGGRCRFNPNIYAGGKINIRVRMCLASKNLWLSRSRTWRGEPGEEWSSAQGLESILISIQSLLSSNPYENEPGYENARTEEDKKNKANYIAKIRHETLRISIIQRLEGYLNIYPNGTVAAPAPLEAISLPPWNNPDLTTADEDPEPEFEPFKDLCKRRFLWYYTSYLSTIASAEKEHAVNEPFKTMPFEHGGANDMPGKFNYLDLRRRLTLIRAVIDEETTRWAAEGAVQVKRDTSYAAGLQRQFERIVELYKENDVVSLDIALATPGNPFVWQLTYFGRPMTQLDGGMFKINFHISPRFPDEQPRVIFKTSLFHHRISMDGVLCYFPLKPDELKSHVEAVVQAIEEESPPYDPRTLVNEEASRLFWGKGDERKIYNRMVRRSAERSVE
ncbi:hypothetical protein MMC20_001493 [Loxospora ochrophaea]|nr:hypothetical protein [Loxospora ochrophaea]